MPTQQVPPVHQDRDPLLGIDVVDDECKTVLQNVLNTIPQAVFWKDRNLVYRGCNQVFAQVAGRPDPDELVGLTDFELPWSQEEAESYRECDRRVIDSGVSEVGIIETQINANGELTWLETSKVPLRNDAGEVVGILGTYSDITELKQAQEELKNANEELENRVAERTRQLQFAADHDGLTGLLNRNAFISRLDKILESCAAKSLALLFIDLDNFKPINDTEGHESGDKLLIQLASILRDFLGPDDIAGRLGGDEFLLLLNNKTKHQVSEVGEQIRRRMRYCSQSGVQDMVTASIGIVHCAPSDYRNSEDLVNDADVAMYSVKSQGKNAFDFFCDSMRESVEIRHCIEREVLVGISQGQFLLHFQPIIDSRNNRLKGFESLVRWEHPQRDFLYPNSFIPIAESTGAIVPLGKHICDLACAQVATWRQQFPELCADLRVNINVSPRQLFEADFLETITEAVQRHGIDSRNIGIEITESLLLRDPQEAIRLLQQLRDHGFHLLLDDFGTGYSALSYLDELPVDTLKIDRTFITKLGRDVEDHTIVRMILALANTMNIEVVAEGVEEASQLERLHEIGCDLVQGYYFSRPLPAEEATSYLVNGSALVEHATA